MSNDSQRYETAHEPISGPGGNPDGDVPFWKFAAGAAGLAGLVWYTNKQAD